MTHRRRFRLRWSDALLGFPSLELHVRRSFRRLPGLRTIRWSLGRAPGRLEAAAREGVLPTDRVSAPPLVIRCFCAWLPGDASAATVRSTAPRSVAPRAAPCGDRRARTSPARDVAAALGRHMRWRSPSAPGRHDSTFTCHAVHRAPVASPRGAMRRSVGDLTTAASEGFGRRASGLLASSRCVRARRQPGIVRPPARWAGDVRAPCAPLPRTAPCPPSRPYAVPASPPASHLARRRRAFLRRHHRGRSRHPAVTAALPEGLLPRGTEVPTGCPHRPSRAPAVSLVTRLACGAPLAWLAARPACSQADDRARVELLPLREAPPVRARAPEGTDHVDAARATPSDLTPPRGGRSTPDVPARRPTSVGGASHREADARRCRGPVPRPTVDRLPGAPSCRSRSRSIRARLPRLLTSVDVALSGAAAGGDFSALHAPSGGPLARPRAGRPDGSPWVG